MPEILLRTNRCVAIVTISLLVTAGLAPRARAATLFVETIGDSTGYEDVLDLREMADGTLVVAAVSTSFTTAMAEGWRLHLAADGTVLSRHGVGHPECVAIEAAAILPDGEVVFTGSNGDPSSSGTTAWAARLDADGTIAWARAFSTPSGRHVLSAAEDTPDGGVLVAGHVAETDTAPPSGWFAKLTLDGVVEWQAVHGSGRGEAVQALAPTRDGGYVAAGWAMVPSEARNAWVIRLNGGGDVAWERTLGRPLQDDEASAIVELADGGFLVAGAFVTSLGPEGGWLAQLFGNGDLFVDFYDCIGDAGALQDVVATRDGGALTLGRVDASWLHPGSELVLRRHAGTGPDGFGRGWVRAYAADQGAGGSRAIELADGGLLVGGAWDSGFPQQELMLLRTDARGEVAGCGLEVEPWVTGESTVTRQRFGTSVRTSALALDGAITLANSTPATAGVVHCSAFACPTLTCGGVVVMPAPACEGEPQVFSVTVTGGEGAVTLSWDFDGDTREDASGNDVSRTLPVGATVVTATATDECGVPATCEISGVATVLSAAVPGEVSDVVGGAPPLRVDRGGARLTFERVADAVSYSAYVDVIGSWYAPTAATGSACDLTAWTDNGDGTLSLDFTVRADSWVLLTAGTPCAEGPAGADSFGTARESVGTWSLCGF